MCLLCVLVLLVMAAAPRLHTTVCTGDCCVVHLQPKKKGCSGCCKDKAPTPPAEREPDEERQRAQCGPGCCVHIDVDVDPAPVPGTIARVQLPPAAVVPEPQRVASPRARWPQWTLPHDTGPPRIDRRTALRASTVLTL
jgi:hypothetical protein